MWRRKEKKTEDDSRKWKVNAAETNKIYLKVHEKWAFELAG